MLGGVGLAVLVPMEEREIDDPQKVVALTRKLERIGHMVAHAAQDLVGGKTRTGSKHHKVAGLDVHTATKLGHLLIGEELDDRAVDGAVLAECDPSKTLGTERSGDACELVDLGARPGTCALGVDGLDNGALLVRSARKHLELGVLEHVGKVNEVHTKTGIGLVGTVGVHSVPVLDAAERRRQLNAHATERVDEHFLERAHDVVLVNEGHLDIDLGELGLAVGAQVLVAEALGNLVVALDATDHEELL